MKLDLLRSESRVRRNNAEQRNLSQLADESSLLWPCAGAVEHYRHNSELQLPSNTADKSNFKGNLLTGHFQAAAPWPNVFIS